MQFELQEATNAGIEPKNGGGLRINKQKTVSRHNFIYGYNTGHSKTNGEFVLCWPVSVYIPLVDMDVSGKYLSFNVILCF